MSPVTLTTRFAYLERPAIDRPEANTHTGMPRRPRLLTTLRAMKLPSSTIAPAFAGAASGFIPTADTTANLSIPYQCGHTRRYTRRATQGALTERCADSGTVYFGATK